MMMSMVNSGLKGLTTAGYEHLPRLEKTKKGGGLGVIYRSSLKLTKIQNKRFRSFDHMCFNLKNRSFSYQISAVSRPPPSPANGLTLAIVSITLKTFSYQGQKWQLMVIMKLQLVHKWSNSYRWYELGGSETTLTKKIFYLVIQV